MSKRIHLNIGGMTCVNCQEKIEKGLITLIQELDYEVITSQKNISPGLVNIISMLVIIVALYVTLQSLGILNRLVPSQLADTGMGYGMLFVIGLITSVHWHFHIT